MMDFPGKRRIRVYQCASVVEYCFHLRSWLTRFFQLPNLVVGP